MKETAKIVCEHKFKNNRKEVDKIAFNKKWAECINIAVKNKYFSK